MKLDRKSSLIAGGDVFFISDTHFFHGNIIKEDYCGRPFRHIEDMNEQMIQMWNEKVKPEDTVIHLGDMSMGGWQKFEACAKLLNGRIIMTRGNHDPDGLRYMLFSDKAVADLVVKFAVKHNISQDTIKEKFSEQHPMLADLISDQGIMTISDLQLMRDDGWGLPMPPPSACKIIAVDTLYLTGFGLSSKPVVCSHYPMESWLGSSAKDKSSLHLHGHCHGRMTNARFNRLDLSCDNIYRLFPKMGVKAFAPLSITELKLAISKHNEIY
jgi:calcineurin-like phosphoesterase family protein